MRSLVKKSKFFCYLILKIILNFLQKKEVLPIYKNIKPCISIEILSLVVVVTLKVSKAGCQSTNIVVQRYTTYFGGL